MNDRLKHQLLIVLVNLLEQKGIIKYDLKSLNVLINIIEEYFELLMKDSLKNFYLLKDKPYLDSLDSYLLSQIEIFKITNYKVNKYFKNYKIKKVKDKSIKVIENIVNLNEIVVNNDNLIFRDKKENIKEIKELNYNLLNKINNFKIN